MDLLTQGILGASIAQGFYAKKLGSKSKWIGAVLGMLPDADVLFTQDPIKAMYLHRGYTHSIPVTILMGIVFGWLLWRYFDRDKPVLRKEWIGLSIVVLVTHPLLDWFTAYGTQLLLPFTNKRFALDAVAVIDFFYTVPLIAILGLGYFYKQAQFKMAQLTLYATTLYLFLGVGLNHHVIGVAKEQLTVSKDAEITSYPLLFQPFLRHVLCKDGTVVQAGFYSLVARNGIRFKRHENPIDKKIDDLHTTDEGQIFYWFSNAKQTHYIREPSESDLEHFDGSFDRQGKLTLVRFTDARYVTLFDPFEGLWGVQALYDENNNRVSDVWYFRKYRALSPKTLQAFFSLIWEAAIHGPSIDDLEDIF